jgi:hypothetical protein
VQEFALLHANETAARFLLCSLIAFCFFSLDSADAGIFNAFGTGVRFHSAVKIFASCKTAFGVNIGPN